MESETVAFRFPATISPPTTEFQRQRARNKQEPGRRRQRLYQTVTNAIDFYRLPRKRSKNEENCFLKQLTCLSTDVFVAVAGQITAIIFP
jgi:hypothetical protein